MKRILTTIALAATISFTTMAQTGIFPSKATIDDFRPKDGKIELIDDRLLHHYPTDTLAQLFDEWDKFTKKYPTNEMGWRNYEKVWTRYMMVRGWPEVSNALRIEWRRRCAESIPNTYTYYFMGVEDYIKLQDPSEINNWKTRQRAKYKNACKAMELLPDDVISEDVIDLISTMMNDNDTVRIKKLVTELYDRGLYPDYKLQYHFNELQGMPENALYIGEGHRAIIPKLVIQHVLGMHRDKVFYNLGYSIDSGYNSLCFRSFGIPEIEKDGYGFPAKNVVQHICNHSPRPVCFSANEINGGWLTDSLKANLYNEGLTMRYSATPYDNFAVKRRNIDHSYLLEYLLYSFKSNKNEKLRRWEISDRFDFAENYLTLLYDQLPWYKEHDRKGYERLGNLFYRISLNTAIPYIRKAVKDGNATITEKEFEERVKEYESWGFEKFLEEFENSQKAKKAKNAETTNNPEKK